MKLIPTSIKDCYIIETDYYFDDRGYFNPCFIEEDYLKNKLDFKIKQINHSKSKKGVIRGFHFQLNPKSQTKIVSVLNGSIIDIVVDLRKNSKTYGNFLMVNLTDTDNKQLFIPKGFANLFISLEDDTIVEYLVDNFYDKDLERVISWCSKELNIPWKKIFREYNIKPIVSLKDKNALSFKDLEKHFNFEE